MADKKLKPEVAEQFEIAPETPVHGGFPGFGEIDLSVLDLNQAQNLVDNGFVWLIPKKPKIKKP